LVNGVAASLISIMDVRPVRLLANWTRRFLNYPSFMMKMDEFAKRGIHFRLAGLGVSYFMFGMTSMMLSQLLAF